MALFFALHRQEQEIGVASDSADRVLQTDEYGRILNSLKIITRISLEM